VTAAIEAVGLGKRYGRGRWALQDCTLSVPAGRVVGSIILIIVAIVLAIIAFIELLVMVTLLAATPFGTIAYLALWGFFPRGDAAVLLGLIIVLKLAFCVFLVLAQQRSSPSCGGSSCWSCRSRRSWPASTWAAAPSSGSRPAQVMRRPLMRSGTSRIQWGLSPRAHGASGRPATRSRVSAS
jgi:hypothetical protein